MGARVKSQRGHVPVWDGDLWECARGGCGFEPTRDDKAALLHYDRESQGWVDRETGEELG